MDQEGKTIIQIQEMDFDLLDLDGVYLHKLGIRSAIRADNDDEFVQRVSGKHPELGDMRETGYEYSPQLLMLWVIHHRGLKCAKALLDGRTGRTVDLNSPVSMGPGSIHQGLTPVHMVADYSLPDFLELFLNAGGRADVPCPHDSVFSKWLPVDVLLARLGNMTIDWTPRQPVYSLIFKLCQKELKKERLLSWLRCFLRNPLLLEANLLDFAITRNRLLLKGANLLNFGITKITRHYANFLLKKL